MVSIKKNKLVPGRVPKTKGELIGTYFSVLPANKLIEFEYLLQKGTTQWEIVNILQKEWQFFTDVKPKTLRDNISAYNTQVLKPKIISGAENVDVYKTLMALADKVEVTKEFTLLVLQQKQRVERALEVERRLSSAGLAAPKEVSSTARKELKLLADILEKLAKIQLETGALKRAPKFISGEFQQDEDDPTKMVFSITENFMETLDTINVEFSDITGSDAT